MHIEIIKRSKCCPALTHTMQKHTLPKNQDRISLHLISLPHLSHLSQIFLLHLKTSCLQHLLWGQVVLVLPGICRNLSVKQNEVVVIAHVPQDSIMNACLMRFQTRSLSIHMGKGLLTLLMHHTMLLTSLRMVHWIITINIHQEYLCRILQVYPITALVLLLQ